MARIVMSLLSPSLTEQCEKLDVVSDGVDLTLADRLADAISLLSVHSAMTEAETKIVRGRLFKMMKLRPRAPQEAAG